MDNWIEPNDSPIWRSLNESHPHLDLPTRQRVFLLLQESAIPSTDKIFPWVVETMISRVLMERLETQLQDTHSQLKTLPDHIIQAIGRSLSSPMTSIRSNQMAVESLTVELRKNSVIQASLKDSGWRGVLCSLEAIAQNKILGLTVGAIALGCAILTGLFVWNLGRGDRHILNFNQQTIEQCYDKFAVDKDGNGWFSCSGIQLPMK